MYKLFKISINYFVYNNRNYIPLFASGIVAMEAITYNNPSTNTQVQDI